MDTNLEDSYVTSLDSFQLANILSSSGISFDLVVNSNTLPITINDLVKIANTIQNLKSNDINTFASSFGKCQINGNANITCKI